MNEKERKVGKIVISIRDFSFRFCIERPPRVRIRDLSNGNTKVEVAAIGFEKRKSITRPLINATN